MARERCTPLASSGSVCECLPSRIPASMRTAYFIEMPLGG
jgi:hypothetical protein